MSCKFKQVRDGQQIPRLQQKLGQTIKCLNKIMSFESRIDFEFACVQFISLNFILQKSHHWLCIGKREKNFYA